ncbi:SDR family NAD(P)-dependent oxidoreductase [Spirillospora sp. NPDC048911]|uniref:SDR family NAD(P)-dependent oxidoreductase n=1 Tax=Spirillospora sp. NPDC048911 TaxID=3364527 RepID=UPI00371E0E40
MTDLKGKTALVTGASRGIGRAIAQRLAADGALVAVHYSRGADAAKETVTTIEQAGGEAFSLQAEFGTDGDVQTLLNGLTERLDGRPLDILVNNAACGNQETVGALVGRLTSTVGGGSWPETIRTSMSKPRWSRAAPPSAT